MSYKNESTFPNNCASLPILVKVFTKSFSKDYILWPRMLTCAPC